MKSEKDGIMSLSKTTIVCILILILFASCTEINKETAYESENLLSDNDSQDIPANTGDDKTMDEYGSVRIFLTLEYICSVPYTNLNYFQDYLDNYKTDQFTYWIRCVDSTYIDALEAFGADMPNELHDINIDDETVIISFNRKLKHLFHNNTHPSDWPEVGKVVEDYHGRPVFEEEYEEWMLHIYLTDKINLVDNEWLDTDLYEFNALGNIPFDLEYYDKEF